MTEQLYWIEAARQVFARHWQEDHGDETSRGNPLIAPTLSTRSARTQAADNDRDCAPATASRDAAVAGGNQSDAIDTATLAYGA